MSAAEQLSVGRSCASAFVDKESICSPEYWVVILNIVFLNPASFEEIVALFVTVWAGNNLAVRMSDGFVTPIALLEKGFTLLP